MNAFLIYVFCGFLLVSIGSCLLGWAGKMRQAVASLLPSVAGMIITAVVAQPLDADAVGGLPSWQYGAGALLSVLAIALIMVSSLRQRVKKPDTIEPDYKVIGEQMLDQMNANVAARKAARKA